MGDTAVDIAKGLEETADGLSKYGEKTLQMILQKILSTNSAKKSSIEQMMFYSKSLIKHPRAEAQRSTRTKA